MTYDTFTMEKREMVVFENRESPDKVYVALGRCFNENKNNLKAVLRLFAGEHVVILHIHKPSSIIPSLCGMVHVSGLDPHELNRFRQKEQEEMEKTIKMYLELCARAKVKADKLIYESKTVSHGIVELTEQHNIKKLVIGASSDGKYTPEMTTPTSSKALYVYSRAPSSCQVWYMCKGCVVFIREISNSQEGSSSSMKKIHSGQEKREDDEKAEDVDDCSSCHDHGAQRRVDELAIEKFIPMNISELSTENDSLRTQVNELLADRELLRAQVKEISASRNFLQTEVHELSTEIVLLQNQVNELSKRNSLLQRQVTESIEAEKKMKKVSAENDALRHQVADLSSKKKEIPNFLEFPLDELDKATNGFSHKIGEGGFGEVYRGQLRHTTVAVKKLNPTSRQGSAEFQQEVNVLSRVRHPNLVTLIGACSDAQCLVYEFLANGSLHDRLFGKIRLKQLWWRDRLRIAAEVRLGLLFLHSNSLVHGDLKPSNILLDANLKAKISDFGICRLLPNPQRDSIDTVCTLTNPRGTLEYIDPQFIMTGELTFKCDIYAFGVIILQLLSTQLGLGLVKKFETAMKNDTLLQLLDREAGNWPFEVATEVAKLGLKCCESNRKARPKLMSDVWKVLQP